jgi:hypothetical protein
VPASLVVTGQNYLKELVDANTLLNLTYEDEVCETAVEDLLGLAERTWSLDAIDGSLPNVTARFDGASVWSALMKLAEIENKHVRQVPATRGIEFGAFGSASGIRLVNAEDVGDASILDVNTALVKTIRREEEAENVVNRIIPVGAGEGNNLFTMQWSTRTTPYSIQTMTGPGGETLYYIEDSTSVAAYDRVTKVMSFKDISPVGNSPTAFENASNALYDLAVRAMELYKDPLVTYDVKAVHVRPTLKVGDTIRLIFTGWVEEADGVRAWLTVDEDLIVLEKTRTFDADNLETTDLVLSTLHRYRMTDQEIVIGALETLQAFKTAVKFYTFETFHGTVRDSIQTAGSFWFDYSVQFDDNVSRLLKTVLSVKKEPLKSNTKDAASGGTPTADAGGGSTFGGGDHSHTVNQGPSTTNAFTGVSHFHQVSNNTGQTSDPGWTARIVELGDPAGTFPTGIYVQTEDTAHWYTDNRYGTIGDISAAASNHTHSTVTTTDHEHTISAHQHTISPHTHALVYGIFEASTPTTPAFRVYINGTDRTAALGGTWNNDFELDITQYLVDADGHPLRQDNTVQIRKASSSPDYVDVIVQARSLVIASALGVA